MSPTCGGRPSSVSTRPLTLSTSSCSSSRSNSLPELVDPHRAGHAQPALRVAIRTRARSAPSLDLADDFLEQILERDDPRRAAVLVDHDDHLRSLPPHRREHGVERRGLGHQRQRAARAPGPTVSRAQQQPQQSLMWIMPTM